MTFYRFLAIYQFMDSGNHIKRVFDVIEESDTFENEINAWRKVSFDAVCWAYEQELNGMVQLHKIELMEVNG